MRQLIIQKFKFSKNRIKNTLFRGVVIAWIVLTIPVSALVYLYYVNRSEAELRQKRNVAERVLVDVFEKQARYGDVVNARGYVTSLASTLDLSYFLVCKDGNDLFGDINSVICPADLNYHSINLLGGDLRLGFVWREDDVEGTRFRIAILYIYVFLFLSFLGICLFAYRIIVRQVAHVAAEIGAASSSSDISDLNVDVSEFEPVLSSIKTLVLKIKDQNQKISELKISEAVFKLANQVAHDIRSPLSALKIMAAKEMRRPTDSTPLMISAIERIESIATDLLKNSSSIDGLNFEKTQLISFDDISDFVELKRIEFAGRIVVELKNETNFGASRLPLEKDVLLRILSNLMNNSLEAIDKKQSSVLISVLSDKSTFCLMVEDNGRGIASEDLQKISSGDFSIGKSDLRTSGQGGFGLGLSHAKKCIRSVGGSLDIESKIGHYTRVTIKLPLSNLE